MILKGEIVVASDPVLRDMYCCEVLTGTDEGNLLNCRILYMIAYPIQYSPGNPSICEEHPPILANEIAQLHFVRRVTTPDRNYRDYEASFYKCLNDYTQRRKHLADIPVERKRFAWHVPIPDPDELDILQRHALQRFSENGKRGKKR